MNQNSKVRWSGLVIFAAVLGLLVISLTGVMCSKAPTVSDRVVEETALVKADSQSTSQLKFNPILNPSSNPSSDEIFNQMGIEKTHQFQAAYPELEEWGVRTTWLHELNAPAIQKFNMLFGRNPKSYDELLESGLLPFDTRKVFPESARILVTNRASAISCPEYDFGKYVNGIPEWLWHSSRRYVLEETFRSLSMFDFSELPDDVAEIYGNPVGGDPQGYFESLDDVIEFFGDINPVFWLEQDSESLLREVTEGEANQLGKDARGQIKVEYDEAGFVKGLSLWN